MRKINAIQYGIFFIFYFINFCYFIFSLIQQNIKFIPYLTNWNFLMTTTYLSLNCISDSYLFWTKTDRLEYIHNLSRNKLSQIFNPFCIMILYAYWPLYIPYLIANAEKFTVLKFLPDLYVHAKIEIYVILELVSI